MLVYLLEHQQVSIVRLATAFNISESSVFRKIKELNQLLEELDYKSKRSIIRRRATDTIFLL